jgi:hypothetical protein
VSELVSAGRKVEFIRVRYETVAKKVDVSALKGDFMAALEAAGRQGAMGSVSHSAVEAAARAASARSAAAADRAGWVDPLAKASTGPGLPLTHIIHAMAPSMSAQVTVAYYFITLLHLANEHDLAISDRPDLGDLAIRKLTK